ncbi:MAG: Stf0 family sulfotransferase [Acidiphilium sp.]|nr:Stf0 family sulfotransferase [Acidiphilium sp.]MDD4936961.1 Stf0 family sulfotransferase [Acidiphilium sp.]
MNVNMTLARKIFFPKTPINDHLTNIAQYFGHVRYAPALIPDEVKFIFLCYTNRSGSNLLAEILASNKRLPLAGENLNFDTVIEHAQRKSFQSFQQYFTFLVRHTKENDTVAIKISPAHIELLGKSGILDQIISRSHFILIERGDKLAQAISHLIAFQTGKFMSTMDAQQAQAEPVFDREKLDTIIATIADEYRDFNLFFGWNGIVPAQVVYEQMVHNPSQTLAFVSDMIGVPDLEIKPHSVRLGRQAGRLNEEWRQKYLYE